MTKRVLPLLLFLLTAYSAAVAGPLLTKDALPDFVDNDKTSVDLSSVPMDDIEVLPQSPAPEEASLESLGRAVAAAAIAVPEPATYGFTAAVLLTAGKFRRRRHN